MPFLTSARSHVLKGPWRCSCRLRTRIERAWQPETWQCVDEFNQTIWIRIQVLAIRLRVNWGYYYQSVVLSAEKMWRYWVLKWHCWLLNSWSYSASRICSELGVDFWHLQFVMVSWFSNVHVSWQIESQHFDRQQTHWPGMFSLNPITRVIWFTLLSLSTSPNVLHYVYM